METAAVLDLDVLEFLLHNVQLSHLLQRVPLRKIERNAGQTWTKDGLSAFRIPATDIYEGQLLIDRNKPVPTHVDFELRWFKRGCSLDGGIDVVHL